MFKRVLTLVLTAVLLLSVFAFPAAAATTEEDAALRETITQTFKAIRKLNNKKSFHGYCGRMSSYTRYVLGIDKYANVHNGRDEYDAYKNLSVTTGGYKVQAFPATQYTLEEALNAVSDGGTRDVYNILLGFQKTNTDAGSRYGHAVMLYGILNGNVYFTESFNTDLGGKEGDVIVAPIKDFAKSYNRWATFEGLIYFGTKSYVDFCEYYPADLFVNTVADAPVYTIPSNVAVNGYTAELLMTIPTHERLTVTGLYVNTLGHYFYEIQYDGKTGYVEAENTKLLRANADKILGYDFALPGKLKKGKSFTIGGSVFVQQGGLSNMKVAIMDTDGNVLYDYVMNKTGNMASLNKAANNAMKFKKLDVGRYTYMITCDVVNYYVEDGKLLPYVVTETLAKCTFTVGTLTAEPPVEELPGTDTPEEILNGWQYDVATEQWKYYLNGQLAMGWILDENADYYILEDGTAATGCVEINGENRFFTPTGVLRTGWYETESGKMYLLSNGAAAKGWREIDGEHFFFTEEGYLDPDAEYVPDENPVPPAAPELTFGSVVESLNKFTALYKLYMQ